MTSSLSPYNITLSSDSPTVNYLPYRDGTMDGGWTMTCSQSNDTAYVPQTFCVGAASRRSTFFGASLSIDFQGTAAYLFGTGSQASLAFQVDNQVRNDLVSSQSTDNGLLAKVEGLAYGRHTVYLNVTQSALISFYEAVITIGVGRPYSNVQNRTMAPFTQNSPSGDATLNPQFIYTGSWYTDVPGTIGITGNVLYPRQHTSETGAYMTFQLSQTSAFFIYGLVNVDLGPFSVTLTPPPELKEPTFTRVYNSNSRYIDLDRVMFWASGLDRDKTYSVKIANMGYGDTPWWDFSRIEILDGGPNSRSPSQHPSVGIIAGTSAAGVIIVALLITGFVLFNKRRRKGRSSVANAQLQWNVFEPPQTTTGYPHTMTQASPSTSPYVPSGYNPGPVPLVGHAVPIIASRTPLNPLRPQSSHSYVDPAPSILSAAPPVSKQAEGSSTLSYTKSGLVMSWNGEDYHSSPGSAARIVREEDAGSLSPSSGGGNVVRLPPEYKDAWSHDRPR